jgi:hypothetical protein
MGHVSSKIMPDALSVKPREKVREILGGGAFISDEVLIKGFSQRQFAHKPVNLIS